MTRGVVATIAGIASIVLVALASGCGGSSTSTEPSGSFGPPAQRLEFGHIATLRTQGDHWVMRFDPAWVLSGETANVAAAEDGVIAPGEPMPNDNYVLDETHRLLTYLVADDAVVEVLVRSGDQFGPTTISVAELQKLLDGTSTLNMFEPISTGVWITYDVDTVHEIQQQYHP